MRQNLRFFSSRRENGIHFPGLLFFPKDLRVTNTAEIQGVSETRTELYILILRRRIVAHNAVDLS